MSGFNFSFSGDDIDDSLLPKDSPCTDYPRNEAKTRCDRRPSGSAFPIEGCQSLPPEVNYLDSMLANLPPRISYKSVKIYLENGLEALIPRRELWDVRLQLMHQDDDQNLEHLGGEDVKTGIYEGGFKSWESSSDLVQVLSIQRQCLENEKPAPRKILELGCGTALPSLYEFQCHLRSIPGTTETLAVGLSDYNPAVLQLVTLPNFILSWVFVTKSLTDVVEGQLDVDDELIEEFRKSMNSFKITLLFFSGSWGHDFVQLVKQEMSLAASNFRILGAETIYSTYALGVFSETLNGLLRSSNDSCKTAIVAAKNIYFGVGGSIEEFSKIMESYGFKSKVLYQVPDGIRRIVLEVSELRS